MEYKNNTITFQTKIFLFSNVMSLFYDQTAIVSSTVSHLQRLQKLHKFTEAWLLSVGLSVCLCRHCFKHTYVPAVKGGFSYIGRLHSSIVKPNEHHRGMDATGEARDSPLSQALPALPAAQWHSPVCGSQPRVLSQSHSLRQFTP